ncbi:MAG: hypothetical protein P1U39_05285 [Legionellaceae bacterium]|nr:hypothetical protein [Legionellaceae bacterium]
MDIEQRKEIIQKLEKELDREGKRIVRAGERSISDEYTKISNELKNAKADYEKNVGRPYTPPSQVDGTLFARPRTRTASSESPSNASEEKSEAKFT